MKEKLLLMLVLAAIIGLLLSMSAPALAGQIYHFKGSGVSASWFMYDEANNVYTEIYLYGHESVYQSPPGRPQAKQYIGIQIFQYRYDGYEYVPLSEVWYWGYALAELVIDRKLASASLVADDLEAWKYDYGTEKGVLVVLDLNISWVATGSLVRDNYKWHYKSANTNINYRYAGKSRQAIAEGSISYDGTSMMLGVSNGARIFSATEGYVEVTR